MLTRISVDESRVMEVRNNDGLCAHASDAPTAAGSHAQSFFFTIAPLPRPKTIQHKNKQVPYSSPVDVKSYAFLGTVEVVAGLVFTAFYFIYQMRSGTGSSSSPNILIELLLGGIAATLLGFGTLFVMATIDLYV